MLGEKQNKYKKKNSKNIYKKKSKTKKKRSKKIKKRSKKLSNTYKKKLGIIVLDLDETLFHTSTNEKTVHWRPYAVKFLEYLHKYFYLIVYTRALKEYADAILKKRKTKDNIVLLDLFLIKLYRNSCNNEGKDLEKVIKRILKDQINNKNKVPKSLLYKIKNNKPILNLDNIILINNLYSNFLDKQFLNGIPIQDFNTNPKDTALKVMTLFIKEYVHKVTKNKSLTLRNYLHKNLYKINNILKFKYEKN